MRVIDVIKKLDNHNNRPRVQTRYVVDYYIMMGGREVRIYMKDRLPSQTTVENHMAAQGLPMCGRGTDSIVGKDYLTFDLNRSE